MNFVNQFLDNNRNHRYSGEMKGLKQIGLARAMREGGAASARPAHDIAA
jgi:hypothetical protein